MLILFSFILVASAFIDFERNWLMNAVHMYCFDKDDSIISFQVKKIACKKISNSMDQFNKDYDLADASSAWQYVQ